jgi:uncharacterized damage-inducible protein DinB
MLDRTYVLLMANYNAWMNEKVYSACSTLTDEQRKQPRGAFFKSIHGTLNHLLWADRANLNRLLEWNLPFGKPDDIVFDDFADMRAERARLDGLLLAWSENLEEGKLSEPYELVSVTYKRRRRMPRYLLVVQIFNHQTHHRGQLTTLLTQLGLDVGSTDLPFMPFANTLCEDLPFDSAG